MIPLKYNLFFHNFPFCFFAKFSFNRISPLMHFTAQPCIRCAGTLEQRGTGQRPLKPGYTTPLSNINHSCKLLTPMLWTATTVDTGSKQFNLLHLGPGFSSSLTKNGWKYFTGFMVYPCSSFHLCKFEVLITSVNNRKKNTLQKIFTISTCAAA